MLAGIEGEPCGRRASPCLRAGEERPPNLAERRFRLFAANRNNGSKPRRGAFWPLRHKFPNGKISLSAVHPGP